MTAKNTMAVLDKIITSYGNHEPSLVGNSLEGAETEALSLKLLSSHGGNRVAC